MTTASPTPLGQDGWHDVVTNVRGIPLVKLLDPQAMVGGRCSESARSCSTAGTEAETMDWGRPWSPVPYELTDGNPKARNRQASCPSSRTNARELRDGVSAGFQKTTPAKSMRSEVLPSESGG